MMGKGWTSVIKVAAALLVVGACTPAVVPAPVPSTPSLPQRLEIAGIPVIYKQVTGNDIIAVRLYVRGGSANLSAETAGIESFIVSAAGRGTQKYDKDAFAQLAARTGASFGGAAEYDWSVFTGQGVRMHWNEMWDLFTQAALHPTFPEAEVEIVRGQLLNGLRQLRDNPDRYLALLGDSVLYLGHPYSLRPGGTVSAITAMTRDALVNWHRQRMTKENLVLVVVGSVGRADLEQKVTAAFGGLPATGGAALALAPVADTPRDVMIVERQIPTNYIAGYYTAPPPGHPDYPAFVVATDILSDRLFEEIRTKRNLSYAAASGLGARRANRGLVYVTTVSPDSAVPLLFSEVRRLQTEPLSPDRLAETISVRVTTFWLNNESNMSQAAQLGLYELSGGGWENALRYPQLIRAVTPADVQRVATSYLRNARFIVIGNPAHVRRELFPTM